MTADQHRALVPGTPLGRALYALSAVRDATALPLVSQLGADPCDLVRVAAEWAIEQIQRQ